MAAMAPKFSPKAKASTGPVLSSRVLRRSSEVAQPRFSIAFSFESLSLILSLSLIFHAALAHFHLSYTGKIVYLLVSLKPLGLLGLG